MKDRFCCFDAVSISVSFMPTEPFIITLEANIRKRFTWSVSGNFGHLAPVRFPEVH